MTVQSLRNSGASSEPTAARLTAPRRQSTDFQQKLAAAARIQAASPNSQLPAITAQLCRLELLACAASFLADAETDEGGTSWSSIASSIQPLFRPHCQKSAGTEQPARNPPPTAAEAGLPITKIIQKAAQRHGIEPALVAAVIKTESDFDHKAISPAGAEGLMQLMPETAKSLGVSNTFDAEQNVHGGTRYLKSLLEKYAGNLDKALAAYNWGPGNVDRQGMDKLPPETRDYLTRVKGLYARLTG